jgi:sirohydrochlorin cobaltochelatase
MPHANAIIVFAHGSRDPAWHAPVEAVVARIAAKRPDCYVRAAYLELTEPDLPRVAADWLASAVATDAIDSIATNPAQMPTFSIFPLFFGVGRHAREDLPQIVDALRVQHPHVQFKLLPSAGTIDTVLDASAQAALDQL